MSTDQQPLCEVCRKPATNFAVDQYVRYRADSIAEYSPGAFIHTGCDEHPARSDVIDVSTPLADAIEAVNASRRERGEHIPSCEDDID